MKLKANTEKFPNQKRALPNWQPNAKAPLFLVNIFLSVSDQTLSRSTQFGRRRIEMSKIQKALFCGWLALGAAPVYAGNLEVVNDFDPDMTWEVAQVPAPAMELKKVKSYFEDEGYIPIDTDGKGDQPLYWMDGAFIKQDYSNGVLIKFNVNPGKDKMNKLFLSSDQPGITYFGITASGTPYGIYFSDENLDSSEKTIAQIQEKLGNSNQVSEFFTKHINKLSSLLLPSACAGESRADCHSSNSQPGDIGFVQSCLNAAGIAGGSLIQGLSGCFKRGIGEGVADTGNFVKGIVTGIGWAAQHPFDIFPAGWDHLKKLANFITHVNTIIPAGVHHLIYEMSAEARGELFCRLAANLEIWSLGVGVLDALILPKIAEIIMSIATRLGNPELIKTASVVERYAAKVKNRGDVKHETLADKTVTGKIFKNIVKKVNNQKYKSNKLLVSSATRAADGFEAQAAVAKTAAEKAYFTDRAGGSRTVAAAAQKSVDLHEAKTSVAVLSGAEKQMLGTQIAPLIKDKHAVVVEMTSLLVVKKALQQDWEQMSQFSSLKRKLDPRVNSPKARIDLEAKLTSHLIEHDHVVASMLEKQRKISLDAGDKASVTQIDNQLDKLAVRELESARIMAEKQVRYFQGEAKIGKPNLIGRPFRVLTGREAKALQSNERNISEKLANQFEADAITAESNLKKILEMKKSFPGLAHDQAQNFILDIINRGKAHLAEAEKSRADFRASLPKTAAADAAKAANGAEGAKGAETAQGAKGPSEAKVGDQLELDFNGTSPARTPGANVAAGEMLGPISPMPHLSTAKDLQEHVDANFPSQYDYVSPEFREYSPLEKQYKAVWARIIKSPEERAQIRKTIQVWASDYYRDRVRFHMQAAPAGEGLDLAEAQKMSRVETEAMVESKLKEAEKGCSISTRSAFPGVILLELAA